MNPNKLLQYLAILLLVFTGQLCIAQTSTQEIPLYPDTLITFHDDTIPVRIELIRNRYYVYRSGSDGNEIREIMSRDSIAISITHSYKNPNVVDRRVIVTDNSKSKIIVSAGIQYVGMIPNEMWYSKSYMYYQKKPFLNGYLMGTNLLFRIARSVHVGVYFDYMRVGKDFDGEIISSGTGAFTVYKTVRASEYRSLYAGGLAIQFREFMSPDRRHLINNSIQFGTVRCEIENNAIGYYSPETVGSSGFQFKDRIGYEYMFSKNTSVELSSGFQLTFLMKSSSLPAANSLDLVFGATLRRYIQ